MSCLKFKADYIFTGEKLLSDDHVLIAESNGKVLDIIYESEAGEDVQVFNGIISPGFINAHCHTELSHLVKRIPPKKGLVDFVFNVVTQRAFNEEEVLDAIAQAEFQMLSAGIVAVGDICNTNLSIPQKILGNISYYNFIEVTGWHPSVAELKFEKTELILKKFLLKNLCASITPHASYSVSENLWGKIAPSFLHNVVSIHNQETKDEDNFFINGTGTLIEMYKMMKIDNSFYRKKNTGSIKTYFRKLAKAASVILVHNTFTQQSDIDFINENKTEQLVSFCLCPNANLYIEDTLPPVELLMQNNCNIVIGTDSLASNNQLSVLEELKTISANFPDIAVETLLQWATINGARALQMQETLGTFDKGKRPGIVLIENVVGKKLNNNSSVKMLL